MKLLNWEGFVPSENRTQFSYQKIRHPLHFVNLLFITTFFNLQRSKDLKLLARFSIPSLRENERNVDQQGDDEGWETRWQEEAWRTICTRVLVAIVLRLPFGCFGNGEWIIGAGIKRMKGAGASSRERSRHWKRQLVHRVDEPRFISRRSTRRDGLQPRWATFVSWDLENCFFFFSFSPSPFLFSLSLAWRKGFFFIGK